MCPPSSIPGTIAYRYLRIVTWCCGDVAFVLPLFNASLYKQVTLLAVKSEIYHTP